MATFTVLQALVAQSNSCTNIGSPLYGQLIDGLAADYRRNGITKRLLEGVTDKPLHDALPLRYVATGHLLALDDLAPALARHYPSCGGSWDGTEAVVADFLATVEANEGVFRRGVYRGVQTNEVGRAAVLASGFSLISARHRIPIHQLEIGSSAGLLSRWDSFHYDTGETKIGDQSSAVRFGPEWWQAPPPELIAVDVASRRASDIAPIDILAAEDRIRMLSFVWPDQTDRIARFRAALDLAATMKVPVDPMDAGHWLELQLEDGPAQGAATVVFHSIVWQYLPADTKDRVRTVLAANGARATESNPLLWLRMEPVTALHADLRLTTWPNGREELLANVGYHGADIRWQLAV